MECEDYVDDKHIVTDSNDRTARVWNINRLKSIQDLELILTGQLYQEMAIRLSKDMAAKSILLALV